MTDIETPRPEYEFSEKYDPAHARKYFYKHNTGFWRRLSNWRENAMARKALRLAGNPKSVLDLPCGTGRFWEMLAEDKERKLYVADNSEAMLETGLRLRPADIVKRIEGFQCSAFDIPKQDKFVESVFCMRFLHHIGDSNDRQAILREFRRIASDTVVLSLWVDGNYKARRRLPAEQQSSKRYQNRFVVPRQQIENDIAEAGLEVIAHVDFLKYYAMWRTYVCRVVEQR